MSPYTAYCVLSNDPHFAHIGVFKRDENHWHNRNPSYSFKCLLLSPVMWLMQEWLNRPRDVDLHKSASLRPQLALCLLVGWLTLHEKGRFEHMGCSHRMLHRNVASDRNYTCVFCPCVHFGLGNR